MTFGTILQGLLKRNYDLSYFCIYVFPDHVNLFNEGNRVVVFQWTQKCDYLHCRIPSKTHFCEYDKKTAADHELSSPILLRHPPQNLRQAVEMLVEFGTPSFL